MTSVSKGRNTSKEGSIGKKRRSGLSESDDNASKGNASFGKKSCEFPLSKIYNSSLKSHVPAELFRKDLISAMKLADSEQLSPDDYWLISDTWKQEWEKGVQVPVNPDGLPETNIRVLRERRKPNDFKKHFKQPKKFIKFSEDEHYSPDIHVLTNAPARHLKVCFYDLDIVDIEWLKIVNEELKMIGLPCLTESTMELAMEKIENQCYYKLQDAIKTEEGLGIEYDDDVICDVCRSPDSEEGNEMVFCDACNVCVHQACYGITKIPEGSWVCRSCALGIRPSCILCPNIGGAMKSTRSGQKWTHVSCALWIPEVAIENVDKMEPITKISEIPASRWALVCSLCREKVGACIQCSVKTCKTAYHVTCAFQHGLAMKAIIDDDEEEDDVDLKSYCSKHTKEKKGISSEELSDHIDAKNNKKELEMSNEEKASARLARIKQMEAEFYRYVNIREVARGLKLDITVVDFIYQYWILKRKANFDRPLVIPKAKPPEPVESKPENSLYARMKMFVHLRQDLERVRNLCYMVTKRERLSRSWCKIKRDIFLKQSEIIGSDSLNYKENEKQAILSANHGDTVYDIMSSCHTSSNPSLNNILSALGEKSFPRKEHTASKHHKSSPLKRLPNPYAKQYLNSVLKRSQRSSTESCTEQDVKWKAMSENQKASRQKSKDIANKLAALQEAYKLKPMEIIVDKLPEDHDTCVQFTKFCKRTNILPNKRNSRSRGSPEKLHSEPLNKRAKVHLNSRTKGTKRSSKLEIMEDISTATNIKLLPQNSIHNSYDFNKNKLGEDEKDLINHKQKEFNNDVKEEIELNNLNNKNEFCEHTEEASLFHDQKEKNISLIQTKVVSEIDDHQSEHSNHIIHEEDNEQFENQQQERNNNYDFENKINKNRNYYDEGKNNFNNDLKENGLDSHMKEEDKFTHSKIESLNPKQKEQEHISQKEKETEVIAVFDHRKYDVNAYKKDNKIYSDKRDENAVVTHNKRENEKCQSKTEIVNHKEREDTNNNNNKTINYCKEENEHINHKTWENKKCHSNIINHKEADTESIDHTRKGNKIINHRNEENKICSDKKENEKHPDIDLINDKQKKVQIESIKNINELINDKVDSKLNNHKKDENDDNYYEKQDNDLNNHKKENENDNNRKEDTGFNNYKKWESEFNNHKKTESQQFNYKKEHELLKDVKVSVQRYMGGDIIEERNLLNTKMPNKEISVNSCAKLENTSLLHEKSKPLELRIKSIAEDTKDIHFQDSSKSFPNEHIQAANSRKLDINEVQIVKKSSLGQISKKLGNLVNVEKVLSYEQRLMNSKRLRKEDIIIPPKPFIENNKLQKSNERNKLHAETCKLVRKDRIYKKYERLNKLPSVMKNTKTLHQPNFKCSEEERTPCKKPESNLITMKHHNKQFAKDLSRHCDLETEVPKKDKKPQIVHEKLTSETVTRENLNPTSPKEDHCKEIYSKPPNSRHNFSSNCTNSEMFNKKLSPKSNVHKYNNIPEKLHYSPTSSNYAQSSLTVPVNKDAVSGKEKLRQESAKIRESLFAVSSCAAKSLSGYKIPKKSRTDSVEKNSAQSSEDTCKLSPLYEVCQISQTETYPNNGYRTDRSFRGCKYGPRIRNGEQHSQEQRLLLKLSNDPNYSNATRWYSDSASSGRRDSFCEIQNNSAFPPLGRNAHCDRSCAPADSALLSISTDTGGYWVCEDSTGNFTKHFPPNVQNGDYGLS